jgi:hypothetical protein
MVEAERYDTAIEALALRTHTDAQPFTRLTYHFGPGRRLVAIRARSVST